MGGPILLWSECSLASLCGGENYGIESQACDQTPPHPPIPFLRSQRFISIVSLPAVEEINHTYEDKGAQFIFYL
jgi:hypothetical protein